MTNRKYLRIVFLSFHTEDVRRNAQDNMKEFKYYVATKLTDMDIEGKAHYVLQCTPQVSRSSQTRPYGSVHLCGASLASCFCDIRSERQATLESSDPVTGGPLCEGVTKALRLLLSLHQQNVSTLLRTGSQCEMKCYKTLILRLRSFIKLFGNISQAAACTSGKSLKTR